MPKGSAAPDARVYGRTDAAGAGIGGNAGKCYGENMAAAADIVSTGSYFGDVGARTPTAALTEKARQDIATADRLEAAGKITEEQRALAVASAIARAPSASKTAVAPSAGGAYAPSNRTRGYDGRIIKRDELAGVCGAPPSGKVFCKTTWPGGFKGLNPDGSAPGAPWIPTTEEVAQIDLVNPTTGVKTRVSVSRLVPGPDCYPNGKPWWTVGGAWAARAAIGVAEATPEALAQIGRNIAAGVRRVTRSAVTPISATGAPAAAAAPSAPSPRRYCKTTWPGGSIEIAADAPAPGPPWAPEDAGVCYHG